MSKEERKNKNAEKRTAAVPPGYVTPNLGQEAAWEFGSDLGVTIPTPAGVPSEEPKMKRAYVSKDTDGK